MRVPPARGPLSQWLSAALLSEDGCASQFKSPPPVPAAAGYAWDDEDLQLSLWCCYELHYRGFDDVTDEWEWHPAITSFHRQLERRWSMALRELGDAPAYSVTDVPAALYEVVSRQGGPDVPRYLAREATHAQFAEYLAHRSVYQLKEADPHSFGIPRLGGAVKAALVEIQSDEYGGGRPGRMHAELFRSTMRWFGLNDEYGHYVSAVPPATLAVSNLMSVFALNRRWVGALLGHLAALEMTSTGPNRQYAAAARRLGAGPSACRYFDEHVEADAVHEQIAVHDLCGGYAASHPERVGDILFGAQCCLALDDQLARHLLACWKVGQRSLSRADSTQRVA